MFAGTCDFSSLLFGAVCLVACSPVMGLFKKSSLRCGMKLSVLPVLPQMVLFVSQDSLLS